MSIVLEKCPTCNGSGVETYPFSATPLSNTPVTTPCWTCGGEGKAPVMLTREALAEFIAGGHGEAEAHG